MLKAYLERHSESQAAFAARINSTPATVSRLVAGTLKPSLDLAYRIQEATAGEIAMDYWASQAAA